MASSEEVFQYRGSELYCEEVSLQRVARRLGTPCYVYSKRGILGNYRRFKSALSEIDPLICYAVKANSNLSILRILKDEGSGFDVVSGGELYRLRRIGADPEKTLFSGVGKTAAELETALEASLLAINVESIDEFDVLFDLAAHKKAKARISLRLNPDVESPTHPYIATGQGRHKFGLEMGQIEKLAPRLAHDSPLRLVALSCHIGSNILENQPFEEALAKTKALADELRSRGLEIRYLDLGGGFGIPYRGERPFDLQRYAGFVARYREGYGILLEPGRWIVGEAGALLTRVLYRKAGRDKRFLIVDGGMNDLLRPSLYQAYHEVRPVAEATGLMKADLVGPVCETADFLARDRELPDAKPGDFLAVMNSGAYSFVQSSNYNSRLRAPEVLIDGDRYTVIRKRENFEDLVRGEVG